MQVQPNARKNEIVGFTDDVLKVKISMPPVKGKANKGLIEFLSHVLGVSKGSIMIEKGLTSKRKTIVIGGVAQSQIIEQLSNM